MSEIGLDVGLANDLKLAFRRHDYTLEQVHHLKEGEILGLVRGVLIGTHEIKPVEHAVNLASTPKLPFSGAEVETHYVVDGKEVVKLEKRDDDLYIDGQKIILYRSKRQMGTKVIQGYELRKELDKRGGNLNACVLDYLQAHPELWPESWKKDEDGNTIFVFFWGTIFRDPVNGLLFVRFGYWCDGRVVSNYHWLDFDWDRSHPAASLAS